jgi:hypothetical protein
MKPSREEQECRRQAMRDALTNARLEGLEPDPIFFEYVERYVRGAMTLEEILADYRERINASTSPTPAR